MCQAEEARCYHHLGGANIHLCQPAQGNQIGSPPWDTPMGRTRTQVCSNGSDFTAAAQWLPVQGNRLPPNEWTIVRYPPYGCHGYAKPCVRAQVPENTRWQSCIPLHWDPSTRLACDKSFARAVNAVTTQPAAWAVGSVPAADPMAEPIAKTKHRSTKG